MNRNHLLAIVALAFILWLALRTTTPDMVASDFSESHDVVMFTAPWCGVCNHARQHLDSKGIDYLELDIDASSQAREQFQQAAGRGVPLAYFGDQRVSGFSQGLYDQALRKLGQATN